MPTNDAQISARQMIDDLINDDPDSAKSSFHDFLKAKTISKLNPEIEEPNIDDEEDNDVDDEFEDDSELEDIDVSLEDDSELPDPDDDSTETE